jgi:hypothetical protein
MMKLFIRLFVASLMALQVTAAQYNSQYYNQKYNNQQYNNNNNNNDDKYNYNNGNNEDANDDKYNYDDVDADADAASNNATSNNATSVYDVDVTFNYTSNGFLNFSTCPDGVVQVTNIKILCDSPYTYYYGNGAHRNSPLCDYGDKATVMVFFDVTKSLGYKDNIFIDMGVYSFKDDIELLWEQNAVELSTLVSHKCTAKGSYAFATTATFASYRTDMSEFYPFVEIAFSTKADQRTNLGGVNVNCKVGRFYNAFFGGRTNRHSKGSRLGKFLRGIFMIAVFFGVMATGVYFVHHKYRDNIEYQGHVEKLNIQYQEHSEKINVQYQGHKEKLSTEYQGQVDKFNTGYRGQVDNFKTGYRGQVDKFNTGYQEQVDKMNDYYKNMNWGETEGDEIPEEEEDVEDDSSKSLDQSMHA